MDQHTLDCFAQKLRRRRADLAARAGQTEEELQNLPAEEESEWADSALEEDTKHVLGRLDSREAAALREIDRALERVAQGTYGICMNCGRAVTLERLRALPTARLCADCASRLEPPASVATEEDIDANAEGPEAASGKLNTEEDIPESGRVPPDLSLLSDEELRDTIYDEVREDGRVEIEELRITCHNGVVILAGALPSTREHSILLQLITDVLGIEEVMDRLEIEEWAWQREERDKEEPLPPEDTPMVQEMYGTDDVVESNEEVLTDVPRLGEPAPEEE
jgi:RNA polymerase-binding protein DksA